MKSNLVTRRAALAFAASVAALLSGAGFAATPDPSTSALTLYGVPLKDAPVATFVAAARAAGAKPAARTAGAALVFDAKGAGVPALSKFTLVTDGPTVVAVQFDVQSYGPESETFRKMLVTKYGAPESSDSAWGGGTFAGQYAPQGTYTWSFSGGMKLIYKGTFMDGHMLTYTDAPKFAALMQAAKSAADAAATTGATNLKDKF